MQKYQVYVFIEDSFFVCFFRNVETATFVLLSKIMKIMDTVADTT